MTAGRPTFAAAGWDIVDLEPCPDCVEPTRAGHCLACGAYVFTVPNAGEFVTLNQRLHHQVKAKRVKPWRSTTALVLKSFKIPPFTERAEIVAAWHGTTNARRDPSNALATLKPIIDGMVDAGVLIDDDDAHLYGPIIVLGRPRRLPTMTVAIRRHIPRKQIMTEHEVPW